ncbi:MAG TPA: hypothetical protein VKZ53_12615 [Candidatus Angelobacter sp.]|nr:hypothetical protein [Candidatus Angelobacter sp.]
MKGTCVNFESFELALRRADDASDLCDGETAPNSLFGYTPEKHVPDSRLSFPP